jgi:hypothetical protein
MSCLVDQRASVVRSSGVIAPQHQRLACESVSMRWRFARRHPVSIVVEENRLFCQGHFWQGLLFC